MSKHTKEPWCVGDTTHENGEFIETAIMALEGRAAIAVCLDFGFNNLGMREANARRIVACVNACAGIDTEKLEGVNANKYIAPRISEFLIRSRTQQRDELLAALKLIIENDGAYGDQLKQFADALLEDKEREIAELKDWKKQAIDVENEWDEQAVGKALNVQLGQSIRRSILPKIIELQSHINDLREAFRKIRSCYGDGYEVDNIARQALSKTPVQSLQEHDNEVIERCAKVCEEIVIENPGRADLTVDQCAKTIRALKATND